MPGLNPRPWIHEPKVTGSAAPVAASAVPLPLRTQSRNGNPTVTAAPLSAPRRTVRRFRAAILFDLRSGLRVNHRHLLRLRIGRRNAIELGAERDLADQRRNPVAVLRKARFELLDPGIFDLRRHAPERVGRKPVD